LRVPRRSVQRQRIEGKATSNDGFATDMQGLHHRYTVGLTERPFKTT